MRWDPVVNIKGYFGRGLVGILVWAEELSTFRRLKWDQMVDAIVKRDMQFLEEIRIFFRCFG